MGAVATGGGGGGESDGEGTRDVDLDVEVEVEGAGGQRVDRTRGNRGSGDRGGVHRRLVMDCSEDPSDGADDDEDDDESYRREEGTEDSSTRESVGDGERLVAVSLVKGGIAAAPLPQGGFQDSVSSTGFAGFSSTFSSFRGVASEIVASGSHSGSTAGLAFASGGYMSTPMPYQTSPTGSPQIGRAHV